MLAENACGRYYLGVDSSPSIKDFIPIEVQMPELAA